jgi:type I site-specific restriction-modification system R (restriction) subunit
LAKLLDDEIKVRSKRNLVQSHEFSAVTRVKDRPGLQMLKKTLNAYHNRAIATQEVIEELNKLAKQLKQADQRGVELGLSNEEVALTSSLPLSRAFPSASRCLSRSLPIGLALRCARSKQQRLRGHGQRQSESHRDRTSHSGP